MASKKRSSPKPAENLKQPLDQQLPEGKPLDTERDFEDPVNEASDESFPASDPPAWTDTAATKNGN